MMLLGWQKHMKCNFSGSFTSRKMEEVTYQRPTSHDQSNKIVHFLGNSITWENKHNGKFYLLHSTKQVLSVSSIANIIPLPSSQPIIGDKIILKAVSGILDLTSEI